MHTTQLPFFAVIRATGSDAADFLHNQFSNDIKHLQANQACYATYNTPKGRVIANLIVQNTGNEILLALASDLAESVAKRLKMYVLRAKVQFEILSDWGVSGSLKADAQPQHPSEPQLAFLVNEQGEIQLPHSGSLKIAPRADLPAYDAAAEAAWQQHEILSGYPWICAATSESCVAQMLNQHIIGGVHFRKGCYPGQEVIARAQYRGQVKRGLAIASSPAALASGPVPSDRIARFSCRHYLAGAAAAFLRQGKTRRGGAAGGRANKRYPFIHTPASSRAQTSRKASHWGCARK